MSYWTKEELAYLAGLIDGEGSVSLTRSNGGSKHQYTYRSARIAIRMTHKETVEWVHVLFGGNKYYESQEKTPNRKPTHLWICNGRNLETQISIPSYRSAH